MERTLIVLFLMLIGTVSAQPSKNTEMLTKAEIGTEQQQKHTGSILGTVIDIDSRDPIENAAVEVLGTGVRTAASKDGQFKFTNIAEGFYQIRCTAAGYEGQTQNNLFVEGAKPATSFFMLKKTGAQPVTAAENSEPVPISTTSPGYPYEAKKERVEGIFYFVVEISSSGTITAVKCVDKNVFADDGKVKDAEIREKKKYIQAVNQLEKEALESIWQWKFKPAMKDGKPIMSRVTLPVKFKLSNGNEPKKQ